MKVCAHLCTNLALQTAALTHLIMLLVHVWPFTTVVVIQNVSIRRFQGISACRVVHLGSDDPRRMLRCTLASIFLKPQRALKHRKATTIRSNSWTLGFICKAIMCNLCCTAATVATGGNYWHTKFSIFIRCLEMSWKWPQAENKKSCLKLLVLHLW